MEVGAVRDGGPRGIASAETSLGSGSDPKNPNKDPAQDATFPSTTLGMYVIFRFISTYFESFSSKVSA